ncbi:hypothetical protein GCM10023350_42980 [Nocardioides endophyticus]|uniref:SRPBCC family protein n=1 Tax=Nocardioides endophyticus TaxID=1353775 RepID=A0ABP8ZDW8_9ACTN
MSRAYFSTVVAAPVDAVWDVLGRFERIADFVGKLDHGELEGGGEPVIGSVRRLSIATGGVARERLVSMDALDRSYRYEFPAESIPFPVRAYLATIRVRPVTSADATFVEWYGDYDCDADVDREMREAFVGRYAAFTADLARHLGV